MPCHPDIIKAFSARVAVVLMALILGAVTAGYDYTPALADDGPDLIIQDISLSPHDPVLDETVTITVTIKNQGNTSAGASQVVCYIDSAVLATQTVDSLTAGAMVTRTFYWDAEAGPHTIKATTDPGGTITETNETNNTRTYTLTTLAPDLIIQSIQWSPDIPSRGDSVSFIITVKNQGNASSPYTKINFYIDGASRGYQDVPSIDPGGTATKTYKWTALSGTHAIEAVIDEMGNVSESDEGNNHCSMSFLTSPPDLMIEAVTWTPESPSRYDEVSVNAQVKNIGSGRSDICRLAYYIDNDFRSSVEVGPLDAGASTNVTFTWTVTTKEHEIRLIIDYYQAVKESDETNNEKTLNLLTLTPDLIVKDITWLPANAGAGDNVTFTVTIRNQGSGRAGESRIAYYISGGYQGYLSVGELNAGAETNLYIDWQALSGTNTISVTADYDMTLGEVREDNNKLTKTIPVIPPDVIISNIAWSPENPDVGDTVTFTVTVENQGGGAASGFNIAYYIDDIYLTSDFIPAIESGASVNETCTWESQKGRHTFKAVADYNKRVSEDNENNNEDSAVIIPNMPDLAVGSVTWSPSDIPAGQEITFTINIENRGSLSASPSRIAYYTDGVFTGYADIGQISAGGVITEYLVWVAESGEHTIEIVVDSAGQIDEVDEDNNIKTVLLPPPDLLIRDITWAPVDASIGDTVTFTATFVNQGSNKSQKAEASYFVDGLATGSLALPEIKPASSATVSFEWIALAGIHNIKITADAGNTITESDETNNDKEVSFSTLTPDLAIEDISWLMEYPLSNDDVTFIITIKNQGSDKSGVSTLQYSIDESIDLHKDIDPIPAGESVTVNIITVAESGEHTIDVYIDPDDEIIEIDETNNEKSLTFSTSVPDLAVKTINWTPIIPSIGDTVSITATVENRGRSEATEPRLTLHIDGSPVAYADIAPIESGGIATGEFSWTAEAGLHEIAVYADYDRLLPESNENNNMITRPLTIEEPAAPEKHNPTPVTGSSVDGGFLEDSWWMILLIAGLLGGTAFITAFRSFRKK